MSYIHFLSGNFVSEDELLISPRDLGYSRGYAVFDFFRTYSGHKPFMIDVHIERLFQSAARVELNIPWSKYQVIQWVLDTISKNTTNHELAIRITISGGVSYGLTPPEIPTILITVDQAIDFSKEIYDKGVNVITVEYQRHLPASKTTNYLEAIRHQRLAITHGADEVLYCSKGNVLEGATSNFFAVIDGKIVTAKSGILEGITRKILLESLEISPSILVGDIPVNRLKDASEAFLSVSCKDIIPVVRINSIPLGEGVVGPITRKVMTQYSDYLHSNRWDLPQ